MIGTFLREIILPYFEQWHPKFFINIFRYGLGCFLECFPISSSLINSLFYPSHQEKTIEKHNINIHFITGIAGVFLFIFLQWKFPGASFPLKIDMYLLKFMAFIITLLNYYITQSYNFFYIIPLIFNYPLVFSWEINEIKTTINFFFTIYSLSNIIAIFNQFFRKLEKYLNNSWFKFISFFFIFLSLKFYGQYINYNWFILLLSLWKTQLFNKLIRNEYQNLMAMALFFNSWQQSKLLNVFDFLIPTALFLIRLISQYINILYKIKPIENYWKILFLSVSIIIIFSLLIIFPIGGCNFYIINLLGIIVGFPGAQLLKKYFYKNKNANEKNIFSLKLNLIMTMVFSGVFIKQFLMGGFSWHLNPWITHFLMGFFNSWALIPGFSRMLTTFLVGFILNMDFSTIILNNYFLLVVTSLAQWVFHEFPKEKDITIITHHFYKKFNDLLLIFTYNNFFRSVLIFILLIIWSCFLMMLFIPSLSTKNFWATSILLRIILALFFLDILKKKSINSLLY
jgi:hypothetical protein